ncbi:MAG: 2-hydroxyacyl-CoA dehydratase family protein [Dehalococcoidia bacterium]|nr:2-hydroxyacyl-CoA dehydratase family protein [Dehalococcoidia bacterium]
MEEKNRMLEILSTVFGVVASDESRSPEMRQGMGLLSDVYRRGQEAGDSGDPVAWISFGVPPEIFLAMDIVPLCDVIFGAIGSLPGVLDRYIDLANGYVPEYTCSTNRLPLGLALSGDVPLPTVWVAQNTPCDSILGVTFSAARYLGIPSYGIHVPYINSETGYKYTAQDLKRLVAWLEKQTGRKMDFDKLHQVMENSNKAHALILKLRDLGARVPSPFTRSEAGALYPLATQITGTSEFVDYLEMCYQRAQDRVAGKLPYVVDDEKLRIVWIYAMPGYNPELIADYMRDEYGAVSLTYMLQNVVVEPYPDISDYDKIMLGLAKKLCNMPMDRECRGPWEGWGDSSISIVRDYKADGAIFAGHVACKSNWSAAKLVKDRIMEELRVPTLNIELDFIDGRVTPGVEIQPKLDDFIEVVKRCKRERRVNLMEEEFFAQKGLSDPNKK